MTPFEALHEVSRRASADVYRGLDEPLPDICLTLCETCTQALLAELASLFPPLVHDPMRTLAGSNVMGCTFRDGPVDQCALHAYLHEEDACPSKL